jgi:benzoate transport
MKDPRKYLDDQKMSWLQIIVVAITVLLNAIDGFDVLSISFAAPGIAEEWGTPQAALGIVMSMELIGMAIGSFFLGGVADRWGRRRTLLGCLIVMTIGMLLATTASNIIQLSVWRVVVGLGIGGILACINAVVAEFTNIKHRGLCISIMVIGYPLGGTLGGMLASDLLQTHDWRAIFYFGALITGFLIPAVYFFVPESIHWLTQKHSEGALKDINTTLTRMKFPTIESLPEIQDQELEKNNSSIFSPSLICGTLLLTTVYFLHITTFYFILKWSPKIIFDMGFSPSLAGSVLVWASLGGALGGGIFGWLTTRIEIQKLTITILVLTSVGVAMFGRTPADLDQIKMLAACAGFFGNAGISGLYSILAVSFPTHVRATGTGFVIGIGRAGAVLSPILAGVLFQAGAGLPTVALVMGFGSLLAALVLAFMKMRSSSTNRINRQAGKTSLFNSNLSELR